jgi:hypothetical protein
LREDLSIYMTPEETGPRLQAFLDTLDQFRTARPST